MEILPRYSPHKSQWRGALIFYLICAWINGSEDNREAGDLIRHRAHYDAIVLILQASNMNESASRATPLNIQTYFTQYVSLFDDAGTLIAIVQF